MVSPEFVEMIPTEVPSWLWNVSWFLSGLSVATLHRSIRARFRFVVKGNYIQEDPEVLRRMLQASKIHKGQLEIKIQKQAGEIARLRKNLKERHQ